MMRIFIATVNFVLLFTNSSIAWPLYSWDRQEVFLSAVIELSNPLCITSFLLSHRLLNASLQSATLYSTIYTLHGLRRQPNDIWYCKTRTNNDQIWYTSSAMWISTHASPDINAASIDIVRCRLSPYYRKYIGSNGTLEVSIFRKLTNQLVTSFPVPWQSRVAGIFYPQLPPPSAAPPAPSLDKKHSKTPSFALVFAGFELINRPLILFETIHHHLSIGFNHIFISTCFNTTSHTFHQLQTLLTPYIQNATISVYIYSHHPILQQVRTFLQPDSNFLTPNPSALPYPNHAYL